MTDTVAESPDDVARWFLSKRERGNPATRLDDPHPGEQAWSSGNVATPLVHGAEYFADLVEHLSRMGEGDLCFFVDWRGDPDEQLLGQPGSEVTAVLEDACRRGVDVRGLIWRSHWDRFGYASEEAEHIGEEIEEAGGECLRDMRVRTGGSHHQKFVVLRHARTPHDDVAYVGGIDLCHSRRDDERHLGDPQALPLAKEYGDTPAWHDAQVKLQGPVVYDVETVFRERWEDGNPLTRHPLLRLQSWIEREDMHADPLPPQRPAPEPIPGATHHVQLLRTYPDLAYGFDFAPDGERSVARGYEKALRNAKRFIYVEDQYLWSEQIAQSFVDALHREPELRVVIVVPAVPNKRGVLADPPNIVGRRRAHDAIVAAGGDRVAFYGLESETGADIYVHAKVCIIDEAWATIGSDNFNMRSWTHDSELSAVVWDDGPWPLPADATAATPGSADTPTSRDTAGGGAPRAAASPSRYAVALRSRLAAEHLQLDLGPHAEPGAFRSIDDGHELFAALASQAAALDAWHDGGKVGPRPRGRLRVLQLGHARGPRRWWGEAVYRLVYDPDGRSRALRRANTF